MEPAAASLALAKAYAEASRSVGRALRHVTEGSPNSITICAPAEIARHWLAPMLSEIQLRFPQLTLRIRTGGPADQEVDLSLQTTPPGFGADGVALARTTQRVFASPRFLATHPLSAPADLLQAPVLIEGDGGEWADWFAGAGVEPPSHLRGLHFEQGSGLAIDAAVRGAGAVLCSDLVAAALLETGELREVFGSVGIDAGSLWAVWTAASAKAGPTELLAAWMAAAASGRDHHFSNATSSRTKSVAAVVNG